ncbi:hypothetical protein AAC387_Pa02g4986 [Persea americana]
MDSLSSTHIKLLAFDLLSLTQIPNPLSFYLHGRFVSRAETVGVIVGRERKPNFLKFLIDDGTACIPCIIWLNHHSSPYFSRHHPSDLRLISQIATDEAAAIQLGTLARVRGRINAYRGVIQINVTDVVIERDPNAEILHWLDCIRLARDCYSVDPTLLK